MNPCRPLEDQVNLLGAAASTCSLITAKSLGPNDLPGYVVVLVVASFFLSSCCCVGVASFAFYYFLISLLSVARAASFGLCRLVILAGSGILCL